MLISIFDQSDIYQSVHINPTGIKNLEKKLSLKHNHLRGRKKLALTLRKNRLPQCIGSTLLSQ